MYFNITDECHVRHCLQDGPRNAVPSVTAGPVPLTITQWCTHRTGVKFVQANECPFRADNCPCESGFTSENYHNRGHMWAPTASSLTTNVSQNIE